MTEPTESQLESAMRELLAAVKNPKSGSVINNVRYVIVPCSAVELILASVFLEEHAKRDRRRRRVVSLDLYLGEEDGEKARRDR